MSSAWSERRNQKRAEEEARHLVGEAQRILKRKRNDIPEAVAQDVESAIADVETAVRGKSPDEIRREVGKLDDKMDEHLSFARKSTFREYAESIGVAIAIAVFLRAFVIEAFQIPSGSMIPSLEIGDHIFVSKFAYGITLPIIGKKIVSFKGPKRGDIVVFRYPLDQSVDYIKRVVGLPGDVVDVRQNQVFINNRPMPRERSGQPCQDETGSPCDAWTEDLDGRLHPVHQAQGRSSNSPPVTIPPGHIFVMGDNRDNSNDSRAWGTVDLELVRGRALIVWWSRGPIMEGGGLGDWFRAIRWRRFFSVVK